MLTIGRAVASAATAMAVGAALAGPAAAAPQPQPYRANDAGGFRNLLPPGTNGLANIVELAAFQATGARPAHNDDQYALYRDLLYAAPGIDQAGVGRYFKDAGFGVRAGDAERTYSPRPDVTIVRDRGYGVPHIYADSRAAALWAVGYVSAEDRLFFMDIFRHLGRGRLSTLVGGAPANRAFDRLVWRLAPYSEADLQRQIESRPRGYERESNELRADLAQYVEGINAYIREARLNPLKLPGEYAAVNRPLGPDDWKGTDVVATAAVIGAIFGVGGGQEVDAALVLEAARKRFGRRRGGRVWRDFRRVDDPESPRIVHKRRFPYGLPPRKPSGAALPDPGSTRKHSVLASGASRAAGASRELGALAFPKAQSNALLVSARESASGRPLAVFGPQTAYFSPQVLMEMDVHAPGIDVRGVAFPGASLYAQIGRGRDFAWSATTSAQDIVDTFALPLCEPGGARPTVNSMHYRFRGRCLPIEVLERSNQWQPNVADSTPAGSETLRSQRTAMGLVEARATIRRRPYIYTRLRSTYRQEPNGGLTFRWLSEPGRVRGPRDFQRIASLVPFTFNWFYIDRRHIAYQNSGANPVRARGTDASLPIFGKRRNEWRGWDPAGNVAPYTSRGRHPNVIDQRYIADWNGKQGRGYSAADDNWAYGGTYRSSLLNKRVAAGIKGRGKMTLPKLVDAMEDAATVDLRGSEVLPWALRVLGRPRDPSLRAAVATLRDWVRSGAHRIDRDRDGRYDHADAVRIMDAWWPRWMRAEFEPALGRPLFERILAINELANLPNNHGDHLGSAWQDGWYSYALKDLRMLVAKRGRGRSARRIKVRGRFSRIYCGGGRRPFGSLRRCRSRLARSLRDALAVPERSLYSGDAVCRQAGRDGDQACYDAIFFRPLGGVTQPLMPWANRPTFQQAVEVGAP